MRRVFISYRRSEAEYAAGALGRELRRYFGDEQVFRDKEDVRAGVAWKHHVLNEIDRDSALLLLIGSDWANIKDSQGRRRLDDPEDSVRMEITDGLRDGAAILPVLLENAQMPDEGALPPDLRQLAGINALKLRDGDWDHDLKNIFRTLEKVGFTPAQASPPVVSGNREAALAAPKRSPSLKAIIGATLTLLGLLALGSDDLDHDGHIGVMTLSIAGLVLGIWAWRDHRSGSSTWRVVGVVVAVVAGLEFFGALGGLETAPAPVQLATEPSPPISGVNTLVSGGPPTSVDDAPALTAQNPGLTALDLLRGHAVVRYDAALWQPSAGITPEPAGSSQFTHKSGEVFFKVIPERLQIGIERLVALGLANAQKADPGAKVTRRGSRRVNKLDTMFQEIEVTVDQMPLTFYGHYYSDTAGSIQLVGWTGRSLLAEHRSTIEQFVSGFQLKGQAP